MQTLPPETPQSAACGAALHIDWPNGKALGVLLGLSLAPPDLDAKRRNRSLLAVWVHELGEFRFPLFPFYQGRPFDRMPQLLALLDNPNSYGWGWVE